MPGKYQTRKFIERARTCAAAGCTQRIPGHLLMCRTHWHIVPREVQEAIWRHYQPGQTIVTASTPYLRAAAEAVDAVARIEGREVGSNVLREAAEGREGVPDAG